MDGVGGLPLPVDTEQDKSETRIRSHASLANRTHGPSVQAAKNHTSDQEEKRSAILEHNLH